MTDKELQTVLARLDTIEALKGSARVWDIAGKILVPLVLALGAWMVGLEIRTSALEHDLTHLPPKWLKDDVEEMKGTLKDIEARLRAIEKR